MPHRLPKESRLKRHIEQEILSFMGDRFSKIRLRRALQAYTHRRAYLQAVLTAEGRYGLNGEKAEDILDSEKVYSQNQLQLKEKTFKERLIIRRLRERKK